MLEISPHHSGISVSDLDASIDRFDRVLGFELDRREDFLAELPGAAACFIHGPDGASIELVRLR